MQFDISEIEYAKVDIPEMGVSYKTAVTALGEQTTTANMLSKEKIDIQTPIDIMISYVAKDAMYSAPTTLMVAQYNRPYMVFTIKTPEELERLQRREYYRVKVNIGAKIIYQENGT